MTRSLSIIFLFAIAVSYVACAQSKALIQTNIPDEVIAFPGAEGFGKYTTGGRGGKIYIVSNLNDNGPGSFRDGVQAKIPRTIVFSVSGTIHLESKITIKGDVTIAGQTAPGDGICLADQPISLSGDNIIVRYIRFRMGDKYQRSAGQVNGSGSDDAFSGSKRKNIIIDHCSMSWSTDEAFSVYAGDSTTLQWNIIAEPLNYSYHFETGDKDFENHGYGGIWGGRHLSAHHNLFAHCTSRNPRFDGIRNSESELVDFYNNVIYNWGHNNVYGGEGGTYALVNNYYKAGPSTNKKVMYRIVNPSQLPARSIPFGKYFVAGNYVDGSPEVSADNRLGIHLTDGAGQTYKDVLVAEPFAGIAMHVESAKQAYLLILTKGGASLPVRDTLDTRIINDVKNRTGKFIDVQGGYPAKTPYEKTISAWPALKSLPAPADTDADGMPDEWEDKNNLNFKSGSDAIQYKLHKHYTNLEIYLNSLIK